MKVFILSLFLIVSIIFSGTALAQKNEFGAFGAASIKITGISGQSAILTGGRFGWVIDSSIVLGGAYYSLVSRIKTNITDPVSGQEVLLGFNCGGVELEYIFFPQSVVHASIGMLFAGAGTTYNVSNKNIQHTSYFSQNLLLWEPQINIEFNIIYWLHIDTGVSYRICNSPGTVSFNNTGGVSLKDLGGLSALVSFKFGSF